MDYRLYLPTDAERLKALYAEMGLADIAHLPLPEEDPCCLTGIVGSNGSGVAEVALLPRMTTELVLVVNPNLPNQAAAIRGLIGPARVWLQQRHRDLHGLNLGGIDDCHASLPVAKPRMMEFMDALDFKPCFEDFKWFYRPLVWPKKAGE